MHHLLLISQYHADKLLSFTFRLFIYVPSELFRLLQHFLMELYEPVLGHSVQPGGLLPHNVAQHVQGNGHSLVTAPGPLSQPVTQCLS